MSIKNIGRNRWRVIVRIGTDSTTGKPRYIDKIIRGDKQDAMTFEAKTLGTGKTSRTDITFGDFAKCSWLTSLTVQQSTKDQHMYALRHLEALYPIRLDRMCARDIEIAIHSLPPGNIRRRARKTLSAALNAALRWDMIANNPLLKARITIGVGAERKFEAYSAQELEQLFEAVRGDVCEAVVIVMAFCGLRREEGLGLDWEDIDLESGTIKVYKAWAQNGAAPILKKTKTAGSTREVYIRGWGLERLKEIKSTGALWKGSIEGRVSINYVSNHYKRLIEKKGLRYIPINGLRHTHATLALSSGIDVSLVSRTLGHSKISTTVNAYIRPLEKAKEQAADIFAAIINKQ